MNRNKSVNPSYGPSIKMVPVILSRRTQNYMLSLARSRGVDTKITDKRNKECEGKNNNRSFFYSIKFRADV
jgi:hypothetical protein